MGEVTWGRSHGIVMVMLVVVMVMKAESLSQARDQLLGVRRQLQAGRRYRDGHQTGRSHGVMMVVVVMVMMVVVVVVVVVVMMAEGLLQARDQLLGVR